MRNSIKIILAGLIILVLGGCVENREPKIPQFNSGMKKNLEWENYNIYAKENNQPILDFVATTLKYKFNRGKVLNYDNFLTTDPTITIQTQWHNCKISDLYEFKFYMPDGRLYHYEKFAPERDNTKWTIGRKMYLKSLFPAQIQGVWKVEVIANGKTSVIKDFTIGINKEYKLSTPNTTIGFFPYWDNQKVSNWKHGNIIGQYISWASMYNNKNIKSIPPKLILKDLANVNLDYNTFEISVKEDLEDNNGVILTVAKKHNMDYAVLGKVLSSWGNTSHDTIVTTYIIDIKKKKIIDIQKTNYNFYPTDFNAMTQQKLQGIHPQRLLIYKNVYSKLNNKIQSLSNSLPIN